MVVLAPIICFARISGRIGRSPRATKIPKTVKAPYVGPETEGATKYGGCNALYGGIRAKNHLLRFKDSVPPGETLRPSIYSISLM
jgi:hypothetical protein